MTSTYPPIRHQPSSIHPHTSAPAVTTSSGLITNYPSFPQLRSKNKTGNIFLPWAQGSMVAFSWSSFISLLTLIGCLFHLHTPPNSVFLSNDSATTSISNVVPPERPLTLPHQREAGPNRVFWNSSLDYSPLFINLK